MNWRETTVVRADFKAKTIDLVDTEQKIRSWETCYYIPFDRIASAEALLVWILHLEEKIWFTGEHVRQLILVWSQVTGKELPFHV